MLFRSRATAILHVYQSLERELRILTEEITLRTKLHVPVRPDDMERWLMRSHNIQQRQQRVNHELNALTGDLNETEMREQVDDFLQTLVQLGLGTFGAAANEFTAAVTIAAAAQRD